MKFVEVDPVINWIVYGIGALAGFVLKFGIQSDHFPISLDYIHLVPMVAMVTGLTYCVIKKRAKQGPVSLWVWLPTFCSVGWGSGAWIASRFG